MVNSQWLIKVVDLRKLSRNEKKMQRRKANFIYSLRLILFLLRLCVKNIVVSKRHLMVNGQ